jgi:hypothetical protein
MVYFSHGEGRNPTEKEEETMTFWVHKMSDPFYMVQIDVETLDELMSLALDTFGGVPVTVDFTEMVVTVMDGEG